MSRVTLSCLLPTIYELRGLGVRLLEINDTLPRALSTEKIHRLFLVVDNEELKECLYTYFYTRIRRGEVAKLHGRTLKSMEIGGIVKFR